VPFPSWLDPAWHNCLVGCLRCQEKCPENRDLAAACLEGAAFSPEETELILAGAAPERMPAGLSAKLETHDLTDLLEVMPRNLKALLRQTH
jgi:epoxyqueuosine reductase